MLSQSWLLLSLPGDATHDGTLTDSEIATKVDFGLGEISIFCHRQVWTISVLYSLSYASQL